MPSNLASPVIEQLRNFGRTMRGWLGVKIQPVTDEIAESLGLAEASGALVAEVNPKGPAIKAGVKAGDVILRFDGKKVTRMRALPRLVAETEIGKSVMVQVWRAGDKVDLQVKIGELDETRLASRSQPSSQPDSASVDALGMKLSSITGELRKRFELGDGTQGVVITEVDADSSAAEKGIRAGDVIVEVAQEEVGSPRQVLDKVQEVKKSSRKSVLLLVRRAENLRFVALRLKDS